MTVAAGDRLTKSGFCAWPAPGSHQFCQSRKLNCECDCHTNPAAYDDGHVIGDTVRVAVDEPENPPLPQGWKADVG